LLNKLLSVGSVIFGVGLIGLNYSDSPDIGDIIMLVVGAACVIAGIVGFFKADV